MQEQDELQAMVEAMIGDLQRVHAELSLIGDHLAQPVGLALLDGADAAFVRAIHQLAVRRRVAARFEQWVG